MPVSDDPFDKNRKFGNTKKVLITFNTDRNTVYFDSRVQIHRDITEFTHIIVTVKLNGILSRIDWRWYRLKMRKKTVKYVRLHGIQKFMSLKLK